MGDTYHAKTCRRQGWQVMKQAGDKAAEEWRRIKKQGELWKVGEERMKRGEYERRCGARRRAAERCGELW